MARVQRWIWTCFIAVVLIITVTGAVYTSCVPLGSIFDTTMQWVEFVSSLVLVGFSTVAVGSAGTAITDDDTSVDIDRSANITTVDLNWYPPRASWVNNLTVVINGTGVDGFVFRDDSFPSSSSGDVATAAAAALISRERSEAWNWCDMPRVKKASYVKAGEQYRLRYVEVIHRHHKRTPYASNTFPHETYGWNCDDEALFYYGAPQPESNAAAITWKVYTSPSNPLRPSGFNGSCQFPQITAGGLMDSRRHGADLYAVYHDLLAFLPDYIDHTRLVFRVTNNQITSQVAGQVVYGMYPMTNHKATAVLIQPSSMDSLEPGYSCPAASSLFSSYGVGSSNPRWTVHLNESRSLFMKLDSVSGVSPTDSGWHNWFDHYFDNLSARLCHTKPLPCKAADSQACVSQADAEDVFRRGMYEYSFIYRDSPQSLAASVASYGIWLAELADNLRQVTQGAKPIIWRHNIAHDGSMSRLLSILQVDMMVWPGMGSEVVFELYEQVQDKTWFLRVLWGGRVLHSSNPSLGTLDMVPIHTMLAYIDGLVGVNASKVPDLCHR